MLFSRVLTFIRTYFLAVIVTLLLLALSVTTYRESYKRIQERNAVLFSVRTENAKTAIEKRMYDYIQILKGAQALFAVSDTVTREEWVRYVKILNVEENYPGILGLGYAHVIKPETIANFESLIRKNGFPEFKVWPEGEREVYTTVLYLEPFNARNQRAFGFDMFTDSTRQIAMVKARDFGKPFLSGMVRLVQETEVSAQNGFLLYMPLYNSNTIPKTIPRRRSLLRGYVYAPFRVNDLMQGILGKRFKDLDIEIYDGPKIKQEQLLYDSRDPLQEPEPEKLKLMNISPIRVAGHTWQLYIRPAPSFGEDYTFSYFVLGGGILFSLLIFIILYSLTHVKRSTYLRQLITDNATAPLFILDKNDFCTFLNPAAETLLGYNLDEVKMRSFHDLVHYKYPDGSPYPAHECPLIKSLINQGSIYNLESVLFHKNGQPVVVNINAQPIYEGGHIVSHLLEIRDIGPQKEAETKLRQKNNNLQTLNNIAKNLLAELEINNLIQLFTNSCTELIAAEFGAFYHYSADKAKSGKPLFALSGIDQDSATEVPSAEGSLGESERLFLPDFNASHIIRSENLITDQRYKNMRSQIVKTDGAITIKSYLAVPVVSRSGEVLGGLFFGHTQSGIFSENTEDLVKGVAAQAAIALDNSMLFEAISLKNEELLKINNDLDNFVYTASHDLKAPVLNIEGLVYALTAAIEKNRPERVHNIMAKIQLSISKFKDTIQALTDVAKTNKNLEEELVAVDMQELLNDVLFSISDMVHDSGAKISLELEQREVRFSTANMRSLMHNLLTNAIKYRSQETTPRISISCRKAGQSIEIKVSDNSMGIDPHYLPKLFTMFSRYHTHVEGTGIGMYLVKRIVENNKGTINVDSKVGVGTTFTIKLPAH